MLFSPRGFYRDIAFSRGFVDPLVFAVACSLVGAVLARVFDELARGVAGMEQLASGADFLPTALSTFAYSMVGLVITAGGYHLLVPLLARRNGAGPEGTFRGVSYAVQVLTWVPLLDILFGLYLCAFGFQQICSTTYQRAAAIAALPLLLLIVGGILFGIFLGFLLSPA